MSEHNLQKNDRATHSESKNNKSSINDFSNKALSAILEKLSNEISRNVTDEVKGMREMIARRVFEEGMPPSKAMGFSDDMIESLYSIGYRYYNGGNYKGAIKVFTGLLMMNSSDPRFSMGLAACLQKLKKYEDALEAYYITAMLDPLNPLPIFYMYHCYLLLDEWLGQYLMLGNVIERIEAHASPNDTLLKMKTRCKILREGILKEHPELTDQVKTLNEQAAQKRDMSPKQKLKKAV